MKRHKMTRLAVALVAVAAGAAIAGTVAAQAGTATGDRPGLASAAALPSCPSATICIFSGSGATGTQVNFPTSGYHSAWLNFDSVPNGFHPNSLINNSGSDIWVYDAQGGDVAGPYCALGTSLRAYTFTDWLPVNSGTPSEGYVTQTYQPGWFFINYNVNTCVGPVPTPLPS